MVTRIDLRGVGGNSPSFKEETVQDSLLFSVPPEVLLNILARLGINDSLGCRLVCRYLCRLEEDSSLWRGFFAKISPREKPVPTNNLFRQYSRVCKRHRNFNSKGKYLQRTIEGHFGRVSSLRFVGDRLFSGSFDCRIKAWNLYRHQSTQLFSGQQEEVSCLDVYDEKLISGAYDTTIRVWDLNKKHAHSCTLRGHTAEVLSLTRVEHLLFSGASCNDETIRIWDLDQGTFVNAIDEKTGPVRALLYDQRHLISASDAGAIHAWDLNRLIRIRRWKEHAQSVSSLSGAEGFFVSGSWDSTIKVWDSRTRKSALSLSGHQSFISSLVETNGFIVSGSADMTLRIWDTRKTACLQVISDIKDMVTALAYSDGVVVAGYQWGMLETLNFN